MIKNLYSTGPFFFLLYVAQMRLETAMPNLHNPCEQFQLVCAKLIVSSGFMLDVLPLIR